MRLFKHPSIMDGRIHFEDQTFEVRAGVVECPQRVGEGADWAPPTPAEREAYAAAPAPLLPGGPTLEEFLAAGYQAEHYPPAGFAEQPSPALDRYRQAIADQAARRAALLKVLEGSIADVDRALAGPVEGTPLHAEELAVLEDAEQSGKNRKGVLELLALHRARLAETT